MGIAKCLEMRTASYTDRYAQGSAKLQYNKMMIN
jgi:hypothetical protein